jgi:hypothetical protein
MLYLSSRSLVTRTTYDCRRWEGVGHGHQHTRRARWRTTSSSSLRGPSCGSKVSTWSVFTFSQRSLVNDSVDVGGEVESAAVDKDLPERSR